MNKVEIVTAKNINAIASDHALWLYLVVAIYAPDHIG